MAQDTQKAAATAMFIMVCIFVLALYYIHIPARRFETVKAAVSSNSPAAGPTVYQATVAITAAPVRELPGSQAKIVSRLAQNSPVELIERRQGWFYVVGTRGESGWLPFSALDFDGPIPAEQPLEAGDGDPQSLPKQPRRPGTAGRQTGETGGSPIRCRNGQNNIYTKQRKTCLDQGGVEPVV